ncbi:glycosyltransferase family 2 protein [Candidatus Woesearchaeota archaeon]|nr:glycosyltransferase family 2 protein [Candidatus Woesearchaeota archaeon]
MERSITILISAYNEERNLSAAVRNIIEAVGSVFNDYELIILDDGSTDKTPEMADRLARENHRIRVIHNRKNMNVGYSYRAGLTAAAKKYIMILPGSGGIPPESVKAFLQHVGEKDIIVAYVANRETRPVDRRLISTMFTTTLNVLFGLRLKYYLGMVCYETSLARQARITTNSYAFQAEILVRLLRRGHSYEEIPVNIAPKPSSKMFRAKNILGVTAFIPKLFAEVWLEAIIRKVKKLAGGGGGK